MKLVQPTFTLCGAIMFAGILAVITQSLPPQEILEQVFRGIFFVLFCAIVFRLFNAEPNATRTETQEVQEKAVF